jgi:hypothetical protein
MNGDIQGPHVQRKFSRNPAGSNRCSLWLTTSMVSLSSMWSQQAALPVRSIAQHFCSTICVQRSDDEGRTSLLVLQHLICMTMRTAMWQDQRKARPFGTVPVVNCGTFSPLGSHESCDSDQFPMMKEPLRGKPFRGVEVMQAVGRSLDAVNRNRSADGIHRFRTRLMARQVTIPKAWNVPFHWNKTCALRVATICYSVPPKTKDDESSPREHIEILSFR